MAVKIKPLTMLTELSELWTHAPDCCRQAVIWAQPSHSSSSIQAHASSISAPWQKKAAQGHCHAPNRCRQLLPEHIPRIQAQGVNELQGRTGTPSYWLVGMRMDSRAVLDIALMNPLLNYNARLPPVVFACSNNGPKETLMDIYGRA
eukprot:scaffold198801_cov20-Tisochrysis_lutea.AAC.2